MDQGHGDILEDWDHGGRGAPRSGTKSRSPRSARWLRMPALQFRSCVTSGKLRDPCMPAFSRL